MALSTNLSLSKKESKKTSAAHYRGTVGIAVLESK